MLGPFDTASITDTLADNSDYGDQFKSKIKMANKRVDSTTYERNEEKSRPGIFRAVALLSSAEGRALAKHRTGALFSLGSVPATSRAAFPSHPARRPEAAFLDALFDLAGNSPDYATDMASLQERLGVSRPAILKVVNGLIDSALMDKATLAYYPKRRTVSVYVLLTPEHPIETQLAELPAPFQQQEMPIGVDLLRQAVRLRYDTSLDRNLPWKGERLIVFNLTALLRSGRTGPDTQSVSLQLQQGKRYCQAEARAAAGSMLAGVLDLRPLVVLLTLVRQHLLTLEGRGAENLFQIRLRDVCEALALDPSPSNVRAIHAQLERWWTTTFRIVDDLYGMFEWVEKEGVGTLTIGFQVFSSFDTLSWAGRDGFTPDVIQVRLYPPIHDALQESDRVLSVHREILQDRKPHPLRHKLYYWCRRVVQHCHEPREFLLDHLRSEITPKKPLAEFRRELREAIAEYAKAGEGYSSRLPGYRLQYRPSPRAKHDVMVIAADPHDGVVGQNTAFSRRQLPQE